MIEKDTYIEELNQIGHLLTTEKDLNVLMQKILTAAKKLTNSDAGTFYLMSEDERSLQFTAVQTDSLGLSLSRAENTIPWPNLPLYMEDGEPNHINASVSCALNDEFFNIPDVYFTDKFNFEGPKAFDVSTGYRTKSMLIVPMKNHEGDIIGVLQLINKMDNDEITIPFTELDEKLILSMSSQAAISITQKKLIEGLENLLDSFVQSIATAIGEKSKYTQGHVNRVAEISLMIANAINEDKEGFYKDEYFDKDRLKQLDVAAWMHDIGKITTPEYVVDKSKKLETIHDRINTVEAKFEVLKKELEIQYLKEYIQAVDKVKQKELEDRFKNKLNRISDDFNFIKDTNTGGEFMSDDKIDRIHSIAQHEIEINGEKQKLLTKDEVENLCIRKGTLTESERFVINNHAKISYDMLNTLPFPKKLKNVPLIAGGHHEKLNGEGYPFGLKGDEIGLESRILAVADIFEALTAHDRPYKKPNSLNQSMRILSFMIKDQELDEKLVKFFVEKGLHLEYAKDNLNESQMDEITVEF
ncbi:MAG: HD domain-containing phosphohydrolase [Campylobacterota bacterium]|nr:HD domain-containing phosphohydrolase [Campylobacterota bacterium]